MMKYLVLESANTYAVLLDEEGRFVKSANLGYEVGETVKNPVLMRDKPLDKIKEKPKTMNRVVAAVIAIAAVIALFFGTNFYQQNRVPYSSVFMAINPEVEMVLNRNGEVLEVKGANPDGETLVVDYEPSSRDKSVVANELVDRAIEMGFLAEGGRVSIAIDTPDQALFEQYGIELRRSLDGRISIVIEITDMENRNQGPPEPVQETPAPEDDDSGYDDSSYEEPAKTPAPTPAPKPAPSPQLTDDDTDYDDTDYDDDDDDDDSDYDDDDDDDDSDYDDDDD